MYIGHIEINCVEGMLAFPPFFSSYITFCVLGCVGGVGCCVWVIVCTPLRYNLMESVFSYSD